MKAPGKTTKFTISILHGLIAFLLLWVINNSSYSSSVDEALFKKIFVVEELILPHRSKAPADFVFINISKDLGLIKDPEEWGNIAITDRRELSNFFKILADNGNRHRYLLCDLFFEYPSEEDSLLFQQISRCKNILFPYHIKNDTLQKPCIHVPSALADYQTYDGKFSKFKLVYNDSLKTIPLVLNEQLDGKGAGVSHLDLHSFVPRYYIRPDQLLNTKEYPYFNLGELLTIDSLSHSFYNDFLKNKFIVVGNFETDTHFTPIGNMYGPLILIDSYLSLKNGRARISWKWILFMLTSLAITSYILFFVKLKPIKLKVWPWIDFVIQNFLNKIFSFLGICSVIVFLSEMLFSIQVIISPLFLYLVYVTWAISYYKKVSKKKHS